jgi:hypothetical protein
MPVSPWLTYDWWGERGGYKTKVIETFVLFLGMQGDGIDKVVIFDYLAVLIHQGSRHR